MTDFESAVKFVFSLPTVTITLTGIHPDTGAITTRTFNRGAEDRADARIFMQAQQDDGRNLYMQDCEVGTRDRRPSKEHVLAVYFAHADLDIQGELNPEQRTAAKAALLAKVEAYRPTPTIIIDTGNGLHCYWHLRELCNDIDAIEGVNLALARDLGGDSCHDVAHLMRVPYSVNFPNALKRGKGRVQCTGALIRDDRDAFCSYDIADLPAVTPEERTKATGDVPVIGAADYDLSALNDELRDLIQKGPKYLYPHGVDWAQIGDGTRSDFTFFVVCQLRWHFFSDAEIVGVITNPANAAAQHILAQKQRAPEAQASRAIAAMNHKGVKTIADDFPPLTEEQEKSILVEANATYRDHGHE